MDESSSSLPSMYPYWLHALLSLLLGLFSSTANILLLFAIVHRPYGLLRSYGVILFAQSLAELVSTLGYVFTITRVVVIGPVMVLVHWGPCRFIWGQRLCNYVHTLAVDFAGLSNIMIIVSFVFRLVAVRFNGIPRWFAAAVSGATAVIFLVHQGLLFVSNYVADPVTFSSLNISATEMEEFRELALSVSPSWRVSSTLPARTIWLWISMVSLGVGTIVLTRLLWTYVDRKAKTMSINVKKVHVAALKALVLQGVLVIFSIFSLTAFTLLTTCATKSQFVQALPFMFHQIQFFFSPFVTMILMNNYRSYVINTLRKLRLALRGLAISDSIPSIYYGVAYNARTSAATAMTLTDARPDGLPINVVAPMRVYGATGREASSREVATVA